MDNSDGQDGALPGLGLSKEKLEEMLWRYRAEDSTPWNAAILALSCVVFIVSVFLLVRNITANRKQKMNPMDKKIVETKSSFDTATNKHSLSPMDDNNLNILNETLLSKNQNPEQEMTELKERADVVIFPESSEANI